MKKNVSVFIMLVLTVFFIAGCGESKEAPVETAKETEAEKPEETETIQTEESEEASTDSELSVLSSTEETNNEITIYMVRHGKTQFNTTSQFQGWCDSPLTDKGIEQASQVGKGMADIEFVAAYASDLGRQRSTAKLILAENNNDVPVLGEIIGLREWYYGSFEGRDEAEVCAPMFEKYGFEIDEEWSQWDDLVNYLGNRGLADEYAAMDPEGWAETYDEIVVRGLEGMETIIEEVLEKGGGNVLIVSSGSQIPTILEALVPEQYNKDAELKNGSVSILKYKDGEYSIEIIGDTSYLEAN